MSFSTSYFPIFLWNFELQVLLPGLQLILWIFRWVRCQQIVTLWYDIPFLKLSFIIFSEGKCRGLVSALFWFTLTKLLSWRYLKKCFLLRLKLDLSSSKDIIISESGKKRSWIILSPLESHNLNVASALPGTKNWLTHIGLNCDNECGSFKYFFTSYYIFVMCFTIGFLVCFHSFSTVSEYI